MGDSRRALRQRSKNTPVHIRWSQGDVPNLTRGRLVDIGVGGALVLANSAPDLGERVTLSRADGAELDLIEATVVGVDLVVGVSLERWTSYKVRLAFLDPCPAEFLAALAEEFRPSLRAWG